MNSCDRIAVSLFSFMVIIVLFSLGQHVNFDDQKVARLDLFADASSVNVSTDVYSAPRSTNVFSVVSAD